MHTCTTREEPGKLAIVVSFYESHPYPGFRREISRIFVATKVFRLFSFMFIPLFAGYLTTTASGTFC
jgi:hypothetical protein